MIDYYPWEVDFSYHVQTNMSVRFNIFWVIVIWQLSPMTIMSILVRVCIWVLGFQTRGFWSARRLPWVLLSKLWLNCHALDFVCWCSRWVTPYGWKIFQWRSHWIMEEDCLCKMKTCLFHGLYFKYIMEAFPTLNQKSLVQRQDSIF